MPCGAAFAQAYVRFSQNTSCASTPWANPAIAWIFAVPVMCAYSIAWSIAARASVIRLGRAFRPFSPFERSPRIVLRPSMLSPVSVNASATSSAGVSYGQWHSTASKPATLAARMASVRGNSLHKKPRLAENFTRAFPLAGLAPLGQRRLLRRLHRLQDPNLLELLWRIVPVQFW